jgi:hypothetical protein
MDVKVRDMAIDLGIDPMDLSIVPTKSQEVAGYRSYSVV